MRLIDNWTSCHTILGGNILVISNLNYSPDYSEAAPDILDNFEILLLVLLSNTTTTHAITYTNSTPLSPITITYSNCSYPHLLSQFSVIKTL